MVIRVSIQGKKVVCDPDPARVKSGGTLQLVGEKHTGEFVGQSPFLDFISLAPASMPWTTNPDDDPLGSGRFVSPVFRIITLTSPQRQSAFAYQLIVKVGRKVIPVDPVVIVDL